MNNTLEPVAGRCSLHRLVGHSSWRHLDLFSGIGGFALACRMVGGIETVGFCEREPYAQKVLKKHWPDVPICNDIHEMKGNEYGTIELITGGYPCQPFSSAGKRKGADDDRHLWPQMRRIIEAARPRWILSENVVGHITLGLDQVLAELESIGYSARATVIPACAVDARHRRDRVWIMAGDTDRINVDTLAGLRSTEHDACGEGWRMPSPGMDRGADGIPAAVDRNHALGNAIVPQVAAEIIAAMKRVDNLANDEMRDRHPQTDAENRKDH
jgi:DNA (cytosine-5)-methyltransferase 1